MKHLIKTHLLSGTWVNRIVAAVLLLFGLVGLIRIYANGAAALETVTGKELLNLSRSYDLDALEAGVRDNNQVRSNYSLLNNVQLLDRDGTAIPDDAAFHNLVGVRTLNHNTRYLSDRLVADPERAEQYSVLTGTRRSDDPLVTAATTLNSAMQESLYAYLTEHGLDASLLVMQADTGDVLAAVSAGEADSELNRNFYKLSPGSTQKLASLLVLAAAGADLDTPFECTGEFVTADGEVVHDSGVHGVVDAAGAVANSCNCWFADRFSKLDNKTVIELFRSLGYLVNEEAALVSIDGVPRSKSSMALNTMQWNYSSVWNVIGEAEVQVSPFDLCAIASAVWSSDTQQAHLLAGETTPAIIDGWPEELKAALPTVREIMQTAYQVSYLARSFPETLAFGKTGTTEYDSSGLNTGRRFIGVSQSGKVFYLAVEHYKVDGVDTTDLSLEQMVSDLTALLDA